MRMIWGAVRAVSVEMLGVVFVVWTLFGAAGWSLESAGTRPVQTPGTMQAAAPVWQWMSSLPDTIAAAAPSPGPQHDRSDFTANRLDHYGTVYSHAAKQYVERLGDELMPESFRSNPPADRVAAF